MRITENKGNKIMCQLPQVGKKITLEGIGTVLCEKAANGSIAFLGREGDIIKRYVIQREGIHHNSEDVFGYNYSQMIVEEPRDSAYRQAEGLLRRARL